MASNKVISVVIFSFLISIFSYANVGFSQQSFIDKDRNRSLQTSNWYPTEEKETDTFAENIAFKGFNASKDSKITEGRHPLYVLIHGTSGNWKNLSWLAWKLARSGAFVVSANHPDYTTGSATPPSVIRAWEQPLDVSFLLDSLFESPWRDYLDSRQIYVIGYSLGGYSAMALAGALLDMKRYPVFCDRNKDRSCKYFEKTFSGLDAEFYKNSSKDHTDKRVRASIAIAPGFVESMTDESLGSMKVPTLIIGAQKDENLPPKSHYIPKIKAFSKVIKYQEVSDASHFSFMQLCKPGALEILAEEKAEFVCMDGIQKTREAIHKELYEKITQFIQNNAI